MSDPAKERPSQATPEPERPAAEHSRPEHPGPSWALMLALIFLAMLIAVGFAWIFIHPLLHRR
jgi:hypothetical protein